METVWPRIRHRFFNQPIDRIASPGRVGKYLAKNCGLFRRFQALHEEVFHFSRPQMNCVERIDGERYGCCRAG